MEERASLSLLRFNRVRKLMGMKRLIISGISLILLSASLNAEGFRIEIRGSYFHPSKTMFRDIYGDGIMYGIDISKNIKKNLELRLNCKYFSKKGKLTLTKETTKLKLIPLGAGLRYLFLKKKVNLYVGASLTYDLYEEKNPIGRAKESKLGYTGTIGGFKRIKGFKKFIKHFIIDVFINYHYCKMKPEEITIEVGGLDLGVAVGFEF